MSEHAPVTQREIRQPFRPRARLLQLLGDELIGSPRLAVFELVKNAYDADANEVTVRLDLTFRDEPHDHGDRRRRGNDPRSALFGLAGPRRRSPPQATGKTVSVLPSIRDFLSEKRDLDDSPFTSSETASV